VDALVPRRAIAKGVGLTMPAEAELFQTALEHHDAGRLAQAEEAYRRVLALEPGHVVSLNNLGLIYQDRQQFDQAIELYRQALALRPDYVEALNNLGCVYQRTKRADLALPCLLQAVRLQPDFPVALNNLGNVLAFLGRLDDATAYYQRAIGLKPDYVNALVNFGRACCGRGRVEPALDSLRKALALNPRRPDTLSTLGIALRALGNTEEAGACFRRAQALISQDTDSLNHLGASYMDQHLTDQAIDCFEQALKNDPRCVTALIHLGIALLAQGNLARALACYRQAVAVDPGDVRAASNLVYTLHFDPNADPQTILQEHRLWEQRHALPLRQLWQPHNNERSPERTLRIGYLSPDFREHSVGRFLLPLLEHHDPQRFEVFCYAEVHRPDAFTERFQTLAQGWRNTVNLPDGQLAELIRQDHIDILVDLALHTAGNRLLVFARKPAPVQVTYLGYCSTTGLQAIDYRFTDPYLDPSPSPGTPGENLVEAENCYSEQSVHLPQTYWCYQPPADAPDLNPLPSLAAGQVTFGSLNNFNKVSAPTLATWRRILRSLPLARLLLYTAEGSHRQRLKDTLAADGIDPQRLEFVDQLPLRPFLELYHRIDIALDPFPFNGGTTTYDALWMGVPVVSLAGRTSVGRAGLSILSNLGLQHLVASNPDDYVAIAVNLANNPPQLTQLRSTMRQRMLASPLMNAPTFTTNVETAYRQMWIHWCRGAQPAP
jgi:protein O-GlcNAc transferase